MYLQEGTFWLQSLLKRKNNNKTLSAKNKKEENHQFIFMFKLRELQNVP